MDSLLLKESAEVPKILVYELFTDYMKRTTKGKFQTETLFIGTRLTQRIIKYGLIVNNVCPLIVNRTRVL